MGDSVVTNAVAPIQPPQTALERTGGEHEPQFRSCVLQNVLMAKAFVPGMISDKDRAAGKEAQPGHAKKVPLSRRGTDQDTANAVALLASDLAGLITGLLRGRFCR
jgi:hypothetical protein